MPVAFFAGSHRVASRQIVLLSRLAALAVVLLGAFAVSGWLLGRASWVQLREDFAPMQFNAALCLILLGVALFVRTLSPRWTRWLAALPAAIAGLTLVQYLTGLDLGIDQLLIRSQLLVDTSHPGRMAPDVALAFLLSAAALMAPAAAAFAVVAFATPVITLGGVSLLGYLVGLEPVLAARSVTHMSIQAALGCALLGGGLVGLSFRRRRDRREEGGWRFPLTAGVATVAVTLLFWGALERREAAQVQEMVASAAERLAAEMRLRLEGRLDALELLTSLWELQAEPVAETWSTDARLVMDRYPELIAVDWLDRDGEIVWRFPATADPGLPPLPAREQTRLRQRLAEGRRQRQAVAQGPVHLAGGGQVLRLYVPVHLPGGLEGFLAGLFRIDQLTGNILEEVAPLYYVHVESAGGDLFHRQVPGAEELFSWSRQVELAVPGGLVWSLTVRPSSRLLPAQQSRLTVMILMAGISLALLLTVALRLRQTAIARARDLVRANRSLTVEIEKLRRAEEEIRRLAAELEARVAERTEALARSNEDLKQFASFISHELRQPLNSIALWTDLLKSTDGERLNEKGRRYLDEIRDSVQRMGDLIHAQLALSDVSAQEGHHEPVDLRQVVDDLAKDLDSALREAGARLEVNSLPVVRGDPHQLYQLLRNLVDNAVKYRRPQAPLQIRIWSEPWNGGTCPDGAGSWRICVQDNGRGFPAEAGERIFRLFERLDPETAPGSGMGLAICQRVVERLGGQLTAEGRPGEGATFVISLPPGRVERGSAA